MYQHDPPSASGFDAPEQNPFQKFAGLELEDFLLLKAIEYFTDGWSLSEVQERVSDWHIFKAAIGAVLSDEDVEAIVARAQKVEKIAHNNVVYLESRRAFPRTNIRKVVIRRG